VALKVCSDLIILRIILNSMIFAASKDVNGRNIVPIVYKKVGRPE